MKKYRVVLLVLALALALSFTAVSAQQTGGDIRIAVSGSYEPASMDFHFDPYSPTATFNLFCADPVVALDPEGNFVGVLAESWEISDDGLDWTFHIKEGINFQDGTPVNALAIQKNFERIKDPANNSIMMSGNLGDPIAYETPDEYTFVVKYAEPYVNLLIGLRNMPVWSPTAFESCSLVEFEDKLIGAGPLKFVEKVSGSHILFERWDDYGDWNPLKDHDGPVYFDTLTVLFVGEELVQAAAVANGEAEIIDNIPARQLDMYEDGSVAQVILGSQAASGWSLVMNMRQAPTNDIRVRQALLMATDQEDINDTLFNGNYIPTYGPINSSHPCYNPEVENMYPYDIDAANALLDETGWVMGDDGIRHAQGVEGVEDGTPLHLVYSALNETTGQVGEILQLSYQELGVDLAVEVIAGPIQIEKASSHDFDILFQSYKSPSVSILDSLYNSKNDFEGGWAWSGLRDEEIDNDLNTMMAMTDTLDQCAAARELQVKIFEQAPVIPTVSTSMNYIVANNVHGLTVSSEANLYFVHNLWME